jgi:4-oxalomesaconate tautomerase|tara:strand:+ start:192 stop:1325 length:1134 start_codon:yes stop_codon:yes gene_type:complete
MGAFEKCSGKTDTMNLSQTAINCSIIRGGTSRGYFFREVDLPQEPQARERVLLSVIGGPDALQVDGVGGGHPLTNKIAIVRPSTRQDADVDYLFLQVAADSQTISAAQNCGNILSGVGAFAIDEEMVVATDGTTRIRVHMENSGNSCELLVPTPGGVVEYAGETKIDGVPGSAAAITCNFLDVAGSATGALLPTGSQQDEVDGVVVTCIDNGMPVVLLKASDFGVTGQESPDELDTNTELKNRLENVRGLIGSKMNLGNVTDKTVPKMCLISEPKLGGVVATRTFIPYNCHKSIGVLGAVSVATACLLPGSIASDLASVPDGAEKTMDVEHPSGSLRVRLVVDAEAPPEQMIKSAGVVRTARILMRGVVFVPSEYGV